MFQFHCTGFRVLPRDINHDNVRVDGDHYYCTKCQNVVGTLGAMDPLRLKTHVMLLGVECVDIIHLKDKPHVVVCRVTPDITVPLTQDEESKKMFEWIFILCLYYSN